MKKLYLVLLMCFITMGAADCGGYKTVTVDSGGGSVTIQNPTTTISANDEGTIVVDTLGDGNSDRTASDNAILNDDGTVTSPRVPETEGEGSEG